MSTQIDLQQLKKLNQEYEYYHRPLKDDDLQRVNALISRIEARIELPTPGDIIQLTTKHGKYYPAALYERAENTMGNVCEEPMTPFLDEEALGVNASGGAWTQITAQQLLEQTPTPGKISTAFKVWGSHSAHGTIYFHAIVNLWTYNQQTQQGEQTK